MANSRQRLSDLGEFGFLATLRGLRIPRRGVEVGIGDDCAVVRCGAGRWLLTTDALVEGIHFRRRWDTPSGLGRRAFAVNASDIAAMGGSPRFALLSLAVPASARVSELRGLIRGFAAAAGAAACALVGGNLSASPRWMISVMLLGAAESRPLLRSGARPGDHLYVSGRLGAAAFGREILLGRRRGTRRQTARFRRPSPRLELGRMLARTRTASAAIDVSDGLLSDLGHICRASGVGAVVEARRLPLPATLAALGAEDRLRLALSGGEDYELLFTVPPHRVRALEAASGRLAVPVTAIGRVVRGRGISVVGAPGERLAAETAGHDHFRAGAGRRRPATIPRARKLR
ncbi:MAG: thiamine-phosphate kinase [Deltaproteobacteria bacterium]|nr:thiamine-phosphate kinase [Deltaproteobacteria bacterium]